MRCKRCIQVLRDGTRCQNPASCKIGCSKYCWVHAGQHQWGSCHDKLSSLKKHMASPPVQTHEPRKSHADSPVQTDDPWTEHVSMQTETPAWTHHESMQTETPAWTEHESMQTDTPAWTEHGSMQTETPAWIEHVSMQTETPAWTDNSMQTDNSWKEHVKAMNDELRSSSDEANARLKQELDRAKSELAQRESGDEQMWNALVALIVEEHEKRGQYMAMQVTLDAISIEFPDIVEAVRIAAWPSVPLMSPLLVDTEIQDDHSRQLTEDVSKLMARVPGPSQQAWMMRVQSLLDDHGEFTASMQPLDEWIAKRTSDSTPSDEELGLRYSILTGEDPKLQSELAAEMSMHGLDKNDRSLSSLFKLAALTGKTPFDILIGLEKSNTLLHLKNPMALNLSIGERAELCRVNIAELDRLHQLQNDALADIKKYLERHRPAYHDVETPFQKWVRKSLMEKFGLTFGRERIDYEIELNSQLKRQFPVSDPSYAEAAELDKIVARTKLEGLAEIASSEAQFAELISNGKARLASLSKLEGLSPALEQYARQVNGDLDSAVATWQTNVQIMKDYDAKVLPDEFVRIAREMNRIATAINQATLAQDFDARIALIQDYDALERVKSHALTPPFNSDIRSKLAKLESRLKLSNEIIEQQYENENRMRSEEMARLNARMEETKVIQAQKELIDTQKSVNMSLEERVAALHGDGSHDEASREDQHSYQEREMEIKLEHLEDEKRAREARAAQEAEAAASHAFQLNVLMEKSRALQSELLWSTDKIDVLTMKIAELERLQADASRDKVNELHVQEMEAKAALELLQQGQESKDADLARVTADLRDLSARNSELQDKLAKERAEGEALAAKYETLKAESVAREKELIDAYHKEVEQITESHSSSTATLEAARARLEADMRLVHESNQAQLAELTEMKMKHSRLSTENERLLAEVSSERVIQSELHRALQIAEDQKAALIKTAELFNIDVTAELAKRNDNIAALEANIEASNRERLSVLDDLIRLRADHEERLLQKQDEVAQLSSTLVDVRGQLADSINESATNLKNAKFADGLRTQVSALERELESAQSDLVLSREQSEKIVQDLTQAHREQEQKLRDEHKASIRDRELLVKRAQKDVIALQAQLTADADKSEAMERSLQQAIADGQSRLQKAERKLESAQLAAQRGSNKVANINRIQKEKIADLEKRHLLLEAQVAASTQEAHSAKVHLASTTENLQRATQQKADLVAANKELDRRIAAGEDLMGRDKQEIEERLLESARQVDQLQKTLKSLTYQIETIEDRRRQEELAHSGLKQAQAAIEKQYLSDRESWKAKLDASVASQEESLKSASLAYEKLEAERLKAADGWQQAEGQLKAQMEAHEKLIEDAAAFQDVLSQTVTERDRLRAESEALQSQLDSITNQPRVNADVARLEEELAHSNSRKAQADNQLQILVSNRGRLEAALETARKDREIMLTERNDWKHRAQTAQQDLAKMEKNLVDTEKRLQGQLMLKETALEQANILASRLTDEKNTWQYETMTMRESFNATVSERDKLQNRVKRLDRRIADLKVDEEKHAAVEAELNDARGKLLAIADDERTRRQLEAKVSTLQEELAHAAAAITNHSEGLQTREQLNKEFQAQIAALDKQLAERQNERQTEQQETTQTIDELKQRLTESVLQVQEGKIALEQWKKSSEAALQEAAILTQAKNVNSKEIKKLRAKVQKLSSEARNDLTSQYLDTHNFETLQEWSVAYSQLIAHVSDLQAQVKNCRVHAWE